MKLFLLLPLLFLGCAHYSVLPPTYGVDPKFTPEQIEIIEDVFDAWCDAVDYCPERDDKSGFGFIYISPEPLGKSDVCPEGQTCLVAGRNDILYIILSSQPWVLKPSRLWTHLAHEVGHYCIKYHLDTGLMVRYSNGSVPMVIDKATIKEWLQNCPR